MSSSNVNMQPEEIPAGTTQSGAAEQPNKGFIRSVGLPTAIAINMTQMCGIGPFITIPLMVAAFGGPQAILGWIAVSQIRRSAGKLCGRGLAVFDGLSFPLLALDVVIWWIWVIVIKMALSGSGLLLIGYEIDDWEFRVLFRWLLDYFGPSRQGLCATRTGTS